MIIKRKLSCLTISKTDVEEIVHEYFTGFTEDLVLPESDADTDNESPSKPPATMAIVAS